LGLGGGGGGLLCIRSGITEEHGGYRAIEFGSGTAKYSISHYFVPFVVKMLGNYRFSLVFPLVLRIVWMVQVV
jgi:hypothetical protein